MSEVKAQLDRAIKAMTAPPYAAELEACRKAYFGITGEVFEDDPSFELRMILFIEWFLLERPLARGVVPMRAYLEEHGEGMTPGDRQVTEALLHHQHGLFSVRKARPPVLTIKDLWNGKLVRVDAGDLARSFQAGDLLDARLVRLPGRTCLTEGVLCHPPEAEKYIKAEVKAIRKGGAAGPEELALTLAGMLLKFERYRGIKPENIYRSD
ncbi:MAG: hypothetical protein ACE5FC_01340 [Myxococcota bacterium]